MTDQSSLAAPVSIAATATVGENCTIGCPREARVQAKRASGNAGPASPVTIGARCLVFNQVVIYEGVQVGDNCVIEDQVRIGYDTQIGSGTRLVYGAYICDRVRIGVNARVAGFLCDGTVIGDRSTVMGELVHEYTRPHEGWWETDEEPPVIEADTVVGYGARVVGGVRIGPCSYVAAGAVVTKDVPPLHVVMGTNVQIPAADWPGRRLQDLLDHWRTLEAGRQAPPSSPVNEC